MPFRVRPSGGGVRATRHPDKPPSSVVDATTLTPAQEGGEKRSQEADRRRDACVGASERRDIVAGSMGDNHDVTATSDRTSRRRRNCDPAEAPARFQANCRMLADAIAKTGTRLRIALTAEAGAEPFLSHASYDIGSRMPVYGEAETERAITSGLEAVGSTCREFLEEAAEAGRRFATPEVPLPVVWDEPGLVIAGMAPGTVARWRRRRLENTDPGSGNA